MLQKIKIIIVRFLTIIIPSLVISIFFSHILLVQNYSSYINVFNTLFTIIGILYSISIGIIISFSVVSFTDKATVDNYRFALEKSKFVFTIYFLFSVMNELYFVINNKVYLVIQGFNFNLVLFALTNFVIILIFIINNYNCLYNSKIDFENLVIKNSYKK